MMRRYLSCQCKYNKDAHHSIFQYNSRSPPVHIQDVKYALEKTKNMPREERISYFEKRGLHYARSLHYINVVENLEKLYSKEEEKKQSEMVIRVAKETSVNHSTDILKHVSSISILLIVLLYINYLYS